VALFLPRIILAVPRYTLTALFWPAEKTLFLFDKYAVVEHVRDFLYNDERTAAVLPTASLTSFFGPTIGLNAFHNDLAGHDESGSLAIKFGGRYQQSYAAAFEADRLLGTRIWLESRGQFEVEPNQLFKGLGDPPAGGVGRDPRVVATETRFRYQRVLALLRVGYTIGDPGEEVKLGTTARYTNASFGRGPVNKPSIPDVYDTSLVPGYDDGVRIMALEGNFIVDTRDVKGATNSGFFMESFGGGVPGGGGVDFWHYGFEATGYVPLYRGLRKVDSRVLALRVALDSTAGENQEIPFTELPRLGGVHRLRGHKPDRFRDRHAWFATVEYRYPVSQYIGSALFVDVGDVHNRYQDFFDDKPHFGGGLGLNIRSEDTQLFSLDVAYGDGFQVYFTSDPLRVFDGKDTAL
jgi:hypothetical protein